MKQTLKYMLAVVMENLKFAESKHGVIIALNGAIIVLCINFFSYQNIWISILNWCVILFCGISIVTSFFALLSRNILNKKKKAKTENVNLLYFKDISKLTYTELLYNVIKKYNFPEDYKYDGLDEDLCKQIVANAKVATLKFELFNKSMFFLILGLSCALIMCAMVGFNI